MLECVKFKVSVHNAIKILVPTICFRLETTWVNQNTRVQFWERILRENDHETIANQLDDYMVVFKCFRMIEFHNAFGNKRARVGEEMIATTFYKNLLGNTLPLEIDSDELMFNITLPAPDRPPPILDATTLLMRQALSTSLLPPRKRFTIITGDQHLYNAI
jgi:hypothetical protein